MEWEIELVHLFVSEGHNYVGRHGKESLDHGIEDSDSIECVAGRGIRGDRYFDHKENYKGQITFFDHGVFEMVKRKFDLPELAAWAFRRNVILRDVPLPELIGKSFALQGLEFEGVEEAAPCYWMNEAAAEGVHEFLKGVGGLRARIVTDGELHKGPGVLSLLP
jgi:MOSC domain-containing protein YiiM